MEQLQHNSSYSSKIRLALTEVSSKLINVAQSLYTYCKHFFCWVASKFKQDAMLKSQNNDKVVEAGHFHFDQQKGFVDNRPLSKLKIILIDSR